MSSEGRICLEMGGEGKEPQLLWKGCDGKELVFPPPTHDGKVEAVRSGDADAIELAKLAATQHGMELLKLVYGFKIIFPESDQKGFYYLLALAKETNGRVKFFFTIGENLYMPVILMFNLLNWLSHSETLELQDHVSNDGNNLCVAAQGEGGLGLGEWRVEFLDPNNPEAIKAATAAAAKHEVKFEVIKYGFTVTSIRQPYYQIVFFGKDKHGVSKLYLTLVHEINLIPLRRGWFLSLLFMPLKVSNLEVSNLDNAQVTLSLHKSGGLGKLQYVDPNDEGAKEAAKLAADQNGVKFIKLALGFKIVFAHAKFYHLLMLTQDGNNQSKLFFTVVADTIYQPSVLLFKPVEFPMH